MGSSHASASELKQNELLCKEAGFPTSIHRHGRKSLRHRRGAYSSHVDPDEKIEFIQLEVGVSSREM
jgi:hypothetical protein